MPGLPVPGQTFEADVHFLFSQYPPFEEIPGGPPIPITRFFDFHCDADGVYVFWFCNKIEPLPPYVDPQFPPRPLAWKQRALRTVAGYRKDGRRRASGGSRRRGVAGGDGRRLIGRNIRHGGRSSGTARRAGGRRLVCPEAIASELTAAAVRYSVRRR